MRLISLLVICTLLCSCTFGGAKLTTHTPEGGVALTPESSSVFIAAYNDFGPPQLSAPLLGNKWWQWNDPDNHKPVQYDVKAVVYKGVDVSVVKHSFPVIPSKKQDYRYVSYEAAVEYFDRVIGELEIELANSASPEDAGLMYIFPLRLYKTALAMERKLK